MGGGSFLILQSASKEGREGVACVEVWVSQGWAVAAGSWALTTYVLQPQPELWRLGNGSQPNYNDWLPVRWHFSDGDCRVCRIRGERGGPFLIGFSLFFLCMRTAGDWDLIGWREKRCFMIWRGRAGEKPETGDVALMVLVAHSIFSTQSLKKKKNCVTPWNTYQALFLLSCSKTLLPEIVSKTSHEE